ncbi:type IV pilus biogenesis/stability protein PilW [Thiolapillus sp.]
MTRLMIPMVLALLLAGCGQGLVQGETDSSTGKLGNSKSNDGSDVFVQLAYEYLRQGDYTTALKKAKKAVARGPRNGNAHLVLALVYETLGENDSASAAYRRSLDVDPKNPYALNAYGSYLCKLEEYRESLPYFDKALENPLYQTPWVALANAGTCARKAGLDEKAEDYLLRALERNPSYAPALYQMAQLRFDQGRYLSTRAYLQRYREVAQPTAELLYLSILTERKLGNAHQQRSDEMLLKSRFPDSRQARALGD